MITEASLKLKPSKCVFFKRHLQYSGEGIYPLKEKVETIFDLRPPKDVTKTRHIIGLASYYRKFVENNSNIVKPLTELTRKT